MTPCADRYTVVVSGSPLSRVVAKRRITDLEALGDDMNFKSMGLLALALVSVAAYSGDASANVVYDLSLGPTATGTITTDGNTGILHTSDIIDFNITVTSPTHTTGTILGPLSGNNTILYGTYSTTTAFTATSAGLFFDFSASGVGGLTQYLIFESSSYLCLNGASGNCNGQPSAVRIYVSPTGVGNPAIGESGNVEIATVASAVPEPSTWAMMLLGFAGVGFIAYRRKAKPALMAV
jgi:hypothetical protein